VVSTPIDLPVRSRIAEGAHRVRYSSQLGLDHVELADAKRDVEEDEDVRAGQKPKIRAELQRRGLMARG
jgi:hypothetical protein